MFQNLISAFILENSEWLLTKIVFIYVLASDMKVKTKFDVFYLKQRR